MSGDTDSAGKQHGKLSIPLPFEDAIRAALKVKPPQDEKRPGLARKRAQRSGRAVPRSPQRPDTAH